MNRERARELLPIIQAFAEGKEIEALIGRHWNICTPTFDDEFEYRIKPEPREFWLFVSGEWQEAYSKDMPLHKSILVREVLND